MNFSQKLSQFWFNVQRTLFPMLEEEIGELSEDYKTLIAILELVRIEEYLPSKRFNFGRPCTDRAAIARAFIAKIVLKITYTKQLIKNLKIDKQLRRICGWESVYSIPSESKFSRAFDEFATSGLPEKVHQALIKSVYQDTIVGHVTKDSVPLEVREKALKKDAKKNRKDKSKARRAGEPSRRERQLNQSLESMVNELPVACDKGMKKSPLGYTTIWKGYKLHTAVDDMCIPLAAIVTSASLNDCEVAIPLASKAHMNAKNFYDLMDSAYDHPEIKQHSLSLGHVPIIDQCPHGKVKKAEKEIEKERKKSLNFQTAEDQRYKERFSKERFNALYKDFYAGNSIFYKGHKKVTCHVMLGVLTLAASLIIKILQ